MFPWFISPREAARFSIEAQRLIAFQFFSFAFSPTRPKRRRKGLSSDQGAPNKAAASISGQAMSIMPSVDAAVPGFGRQAEHETVTGTKQQFKEKAPDQGTSGQEETSLSGQTKSIMPSLDAVAPIGEGQQPKHKIAAATKQQAHEQAQAPLSGQTNSIMPSVDAAVATSEVNQQGETQTNYGTRNTHLGKKDTGTRKRKGKSNKQKE